MHELLAYRVTTRQRLSWFTPETLIGLLLPLAVPPAAILVPVGGVIGALVGRARIDRENTEGKIVPPPSYFNKTLFVGIALGIAAMTGVGLLAGFGGFLFTALAGTEIASSVAASAYFIAGIAAVAASGYMGAVQGRHRMEAEYHYARLSGTPMDGHEEEAKPSPDKILSHFDELEKPQKKFVAEEISRRQKRETDPGGVGGPN